MLISMTGFGEARSQADGMAVAVEVRTINSRHFKLSYRASEGYASLEPDVEAVVRDSRSAAAPCKSISASIATPRPTIIASTPRCSRAIAGRLEAFMRPQRLDGPRRSARRCCSCPASVDEQVARRLRSARRLAGDRAGGQRGAGRRRPRCGPKKASRWPPTWPTTADRSSSNSRRDRQAGAGSVAVVSIAAHAARAASALGTERHGRAGRPVARGEPVRRPQRHLGRDRPPAQPPAAIRRRALHARESSGRKLEFIVQEMGREVNTIGSKANDAEISRLRRRNQERRWSGFASRSRTWNKERFRIADCGLRIGQLQSAIRNPQSAISTA